MIEVKNLSYWYSGNQTVLNNTTLTFDEGKIYGLLGQNGVGKTTLLKLCCSLLLPKRGTITLDGTDVTLRSVATLRNIYFAEDRPVFPRLKLSTYVDLLRPFYPDFSADIYDECLREFGIDKDCKPYNLSFGQQKKVQLAIAFALGTKYLLLDEPSNGLDIPSKDTLRKLISRYADGNRTFIISTHLVHDVENLLDGVVILGTESVLFDASIADVSSLYDFKTTLGSNAPASALYSEPAPGGTSYIAPHDASLPESEVNIELLYKAVINAKISK